MAKSGVVKDDRDTPMRHRDGVFFFLKSGIGLTTELG